MQRETMYSTVDGEVATVVLNRPSVLNCFNEQALADLNALLDDLDGHDHLRVVVVRGAGRAFCTGIDLTALANGDITQRFFREWEQTLRRFETMSPIAVAAIHSHCIGGGLQLALACDLRVARRDARLGVTAAKEGIIPGLGMWRIARHAGAGRAKRLALTADVVDAETAYGWGLVDYLTDAERHEVVVRELTGRLLEMAATSVRLTKQLITLSADASFAELTDVFCEYQRLATESDEHRQAMAHRRRARTC